MARNDARELDELRPVAIEPNFTSAPLGSALYRAGDTIVLCTASLEEGVPRWLKGGEPPRGWVTAEYQMLPGSTERRARRERQKVGGRTLEIQRLIGRSLRAVVDFEALGERTITIDCEVLQADGGTRTASITGGFVALCLAASKLVESGAIERVPLKGSVAAISCGVVGGELMLDLPYEEDSRADVDFNVVMTGAGRFIEVQGTGEGGTFEREQLFGLVDLAGRGIERLSAIQREVVEAAGGLWPA